MRTLLCLTVVSLLSVAARADDVEAEARKFIEAYHQAYTQADPEALTKLMAEDAVITNVQGELETRAQLADMLRKGDLKILSLDTTELKARAVGDGIMATYHVLLKIQGGGRDVELPARYTTVLAKGPSGWQVIASQSTIVTSALRQ